MQQCEVTLALNLCPGTKNSSPPFSSSGAQTSSAPLTSWLIGLLILYFWCSPAESCLASPCMSGSRKLNNLSSSTNLTSASKDDIISSTSQHILAGWWCYGFRMFLFHSIHPSPRLQHDNFIGLLLIFRFEFCMQTNQSLEIQHVISVITVKTSLHLFKCFNHSTIFDKPESHKVCLMQELLGHKLVLTVGDGLTTIVFSAFEPRSNPSNSNFQVVEVWNLTSFPKNSYMVRFCIFAELQLALRSATSARRAFFALAKALLAAARRVWSSKSHVDDWSVRWNSQSRLFLICWSFKGNDWAPQHS